MMMTSTQETMTTTEILIGLKMLGRKVFQRVLKNGKNVLRPKEREFVETAKIMTNIAQSPFVSVSGSSVLLLRCLPKMY
jgi:hypothetical protein